MDAIFGRYRHVIPEFARFQRGLREPLPTHLRVNRLKTEPGSVVQALAAKGVHLRQAIEKEETLYLAPELQSPGNLLEYYLGYIHPQALTACLASMALSPKQNSYVLDMCAAPGGKTSHLAQLMGNTGFIVANELYLGRQIPLGHTLDRLGVLNAVVTGYPAQEFPLRQRFDYVLIDAPCSGEGTFRKTHVAGKYRESREKTRLPVLQKKIILRGFDLLEENGEMLYATCTYNPEENETVVEFLLRHRRAELLPIRVGCSYESGLGHWKGEAYDQQMEKTARFYPHRINSVGFFMARIGRY
jgi:NOL1/NOP2/sun family putative RNA methylase